MFLMMRYPTLEEVGMFLELANLDGDEDENMAKASETLYSVMISCIDTVVNGDEVEKLSDYTSEEVKSFIDSLPGGTIESMKQFFDTVPALKYTTKYTNSEGEEKDLVLEGTETFFL